MSEPQPPDANKKPESPIRRSLSEMREIIKRLEALGIPAVSRLLMDLRHQMIDLTTRLNEQDSDAAAKRMIGEAEQLKPQAPIEETPLFAHASAYAAPNAEELEQRMQLAHWREGDHTLDREEHAA